MERLFQRTVGREDSLTLLTFEKGEIVATNVILEFVRSHIPLGTVVVFTNEASQQAMNFARSGINISTDVDGDVKRGMVYILPLEKKYANLFDSAIFFLIDDIDKEDLSQWAVKDKLVVTAKELNIQYDDIIFDTPDEVLHGYYLFKLGYYRTALRFFEELFKRDESAISKVFVNPTFLRDGLFIGFIIKISSFSYAYLYETFRFTKIRDVIIKFIEKHLKELLGEIVRLNKYHLIPALLRDYNYEPIILRCDEEKMLVFNYLSEAEREELFKNIRGSEATLEASLRVKALSYSHIYQLTLQKGLNFGLGLIERNLEGLLREINFKSNLHLLYQALEDFDNEKILTIALENQMRIFQEIERDKGHDIYLRIYKNPNYFDVGVELRIWTYLDIYRYVTSGRNIEPLVIDFLRTKLNILLSEIEETQSVELVRNLIDNFSLKEVLMCSPQIFNILSADENRDIFENVMKDRDLLEHCLKERSWNSMDIYSWYIEINETNSLIIEYLAGRITRLISRIDDAKNTRLLNHLVNDFKADDLIKGFKESKTGITSELSRENCVRIFENCTKNEDNLNDGVRLKLWTMTDVYMFVARQSDRSELLPIIGKNLDGLVNDVCTSNPELIVNLLADFDNAIVMSDILKMKSIPSLNIGVVEAEKMIKECSVDQKLVANIFKNNLISMENILEFAKKHELNLSAFFAKFIGDVANATEDNEYLAEIAVKCGKEEEIFSSLKRRLKFNRLKVLKTLVNDFKTDGRITKDPSVDEIKFDDEIIRASDTGDEISVEKFKDRFAELKEGYDGGITAEDLINLLNHDR